VGGVAQETPQETKSKGATIWVPNEFKARVKALSKKYGKAEWKILLDALALYEASIRKPKLKEELPIVDKVIWYIEKLSMSVGELKANPTNDNLQKTLKTIQQVKERLNIDTSILERSLIDYIKLVGGNNKNGAKNREDEVEAKMEVNMALKSVLIEIVYKWILKEEQPNQSNEQG
jgi:hypothetical protein